MTYPGNHSKLRDDCKSVNKAPLFPPRARGKTLTQIPKKAIKWQKGRSLMANRIELQSLDHGSKKGIASIRFLSANSIGAARSANNLEHFSRTTFFDRWRIGFMGFLNQGTPIEWGKTFPCQLVFTRPTGTTIDVFSVTNGLASHFEQMTQRLLGFSSIQTPARAFQAGRMDWAGEGPGFPGKLLCCPQVEFQLAAAGSIGWDWQRQKFQVAVHGTQTLYYMVGTV